MQFSQPNDDTITIETEEEMSPGALATSCFTEEEVELLIKLLNVHYSYPMPCSLAGTIFEELFASAIKGRKADKKLLFDAYKDDIGWSLKTLQWVKRTTGSSFELVLQRCDILKDKSLNIDLPENVLGLRIIEHFSSFYFTSVKEQKIADPRSCFLLRNKEETSFTLFQQRYQLYSADQIEWKWSNPEKNSLIGTCNDKLVYRWYRSGTQLFGCYTVPNDAHIFDIRWQKLSIDDILEIISSKQKEPQS